MNTFNQQFPALVEHIKEAPEKYIFLFFSLGHIYQGIKSNSKSRFATEDDEEIIGSEYGKWTYLIIVFVI